ncbi:capsular polysaccharide transport system permease protein [Eilatimonas milleporae]|uniref:Capsular polysaccharide transport system permease protein n=2 Tax=Eilatimonas milleporae TaxID=911205 RepID=A0A3M0CS95_9PROT|nr:capsular polysaccharide transport system permease protein [Eilatimonas milleporae]
MREAIGTFMNMMDFVRTAVSRSPVPFEWLHQRRVLKKTRADAMGALGVPMRDVRSSVMTFSTYRWVLVAVALVAAYYFFLASNRYVTESQVYVRSMMPTAQVMPNLPMLPSANPQMQDALLLREYIHSKDMLVHLDTVLGLNDHFSGRDWDIFSRMDSAPTREGFLSYYRDRVELILNPDSGILTIRVQGFTPDYSLALSQEINKEAEAFINRVGQSIAAEEIGFIEGELDRARGNLADVRRRLLAFQNENQLLDPGVTTAARQMAINELEAELVRLSADEKSLASYLNEDAPQIVTLRDRIAATQAQLGVERAKLTSEEAQSLNDVAADFQELKMELEFASDIYQTALISIEKARVDAYRKLKHLVVVQSPALPDEALYPRGLYNTATVFVVLSLVYGIAVMLIATIREHRDV